MTVPERKNAATFIKYTTVRPFIFMGFSFKCFFCTEYHSEVTALLNHTLTHQVEDTNIILEKYIPKGKRTLQVDISMLKCRLCNQPYPDLNTIRAHLTDRHGTLFHTASNGMTEYNMELINNMFTCHICSKVFHNFRVLNSHMNIHVGKVVCENCGAGFLNQHLLLKHKETHLTKKFDCGQCDKIFYKKSQLKYHTEIIHKRKERVTPKKCPQCPQTFREHYTKMMHLRKAHGIMKNFICHICQSHFATRRALTEHATRYHTEKFKCEICSKCFGIESKLRQHMRGHTGERNFVCHICKNSYMHKTTLKKHIRRHDTEFKFSCTDCGVGFVRKKDLDRHMKQKCIEETS